jgi:hypothetical protein
VPPVTYKSLIACPFLSLSLLFSLNLLFSLFLLSLPPSFTLPPLKLLHADLIVDHSTPALAFHQESIGIVDGFKGFLSLKLLGFGLQISELVRVVPHC